MHSAVGFGFPESTSIVLLYLNIGYEVYCSKLNTSDRYPIGQYTSLVF